MAYVTEAEIEAYTGKSFTATSVITSTQIGVMATQFSAKLDGFAGVDEGTYGTDTTCDEWVKQAVLSVISYAITQYYNDQPVDELVDNRFGDRHDPFVRAPEPVIIRRLHGYDSCVRHADIFRGGFRVMHEIVGANINTGLSECFQPVVAGHAGPCTGSSIPHAIKEGVGFLSDFCSQFIPKIESA